MFLDYCLINHSISGSTYDLDIVPHEQIDPSNYFTLSYSGVTHFIEDDGIAGSEFTQLDQFEREHYLFSQICKLRFFQQFWMAKLFTTWRKNLRATKMKQAQERLQENLFILHPVLRKPLLELHDLSVKAENFNLYDVQTAPTSPVSSSSSKSEEKGGLKPYTLDEFCDAQLLKSDKIKLLLDNIFQTQIVVAFNACENTLNTFLVDNHFHTTSDVASYNKDPLQQRRTNNDVDGVGASGNNVITVSFTERAAMRTQCKKLVKFIRLGKTIDHDGGR